MARRSEAEWREILSRQRDSGLNDQEFAQREGVGIASLRNWRQRIRQKPEASFGLVEVGSFSSGTEVQVRLPNGVVVEIRSHWKNPGLTDFISGLKSL